MLPVDVTEELLILCSHSVAIDAQTDSTIFVRADCFRHYPNGPSLPTDKANYLDFSEYPNIQRNLYCC
jgi:hypothetical protein